VAPFLIFLPEIKYMVNFLVRTVSPVLIASCLLLPVHAAEGEYSIAVGDAQTGSSLSKSHASLGINVDVNKNWDELSADEKSLWRKFVDITDANVIPPFPSPNIRTLLRNLGVSRGIRTDNTNSHKEDVRLIVHVDETGSVSAVDILGAKSNGEIALSDDEKILAYTTIKALQSTQFSPAKLDGAPVASAFAYHVVRSTKR
jgi:hypothetical protein